jgi:hypothetical protein
MGGVRLCGCWRGCRLTRGDAAAGRPGGDVRGSGPALCESGLPRLGRPWKALGRPLRAVAWGGR